MGAHRDTETDAGDPEDEGLPSGTETTPPEPPAGYTDPYSLEVPTVKVMGAANVVLAVTAVGFGFVLVESRPQVGLGLDLTGSLLRALPWVVAISIGVPVAVLGGRLLVAGVALRGLGYRPELEIAFNTGIDSIVGVIARGQFVDRTHALATRLAPLTVGLVVLVPAMMIAPGTLATVAYLLLVLTTTTATWDLYAVWRILRLPEETLFYAKTLEVVVYEPAGR